VDQDVLALERLDGPGAVRRPPRVGIGERLRSLRRSLGLSLTEVQSRTDGEFKASALGAYERGERALSIERLTRLAAVYNVDASTLVTADATIDLPAMHAGDEAVRTPYDDAFVLAALARFAAYVRARRNEPTLTPLVVRAHDVEHLTVVLGLTQGRLNDLLGQLGLCTRAP
jgi:transcriptional regulator with XRE-family HTH domain